MATDDKHPDFPVVPTTSVAEQIEEAAAHAEALRVGSTEGSKPGYEPKDHPLAEFEGGDSDDEFEEPDQGIAEVPDAIPDVKAMVGTITFTGTDNGGDFDQVIRNLIFTGEKLGLFYLSACSSELPEEYVKPGSLLHQQLTGRNQ